jgi:hydroxyethylthiazole kinase-like uncharacterized protein yjeF
MMTRPILTAAEVRAAESAVIEAGTSAETLMERAGAGAAEAIWRFAGPRPTLILCGPGNNGGDGYVIARLLQERGIAVRVAALSGPSSAAAQWARSLWSGQVEDILDTKGAPILIDALFGTGLTRPLADPASGALMRLASEAEIRVAIDLPSGSATDDGRLLSAVPDYDLTVTFASLKPSHLLQPAARHIGRLVLVDIGVPAAASLHEIRPPSLRAPGPDDHKYSRGYVAVLAGEMPGAAALTASAAARAGAGYVRVLGDVILAGVPKAVVQGGNSAALIGDRRIGAIAVGPGLGRGSEAAALVEAVIDVGRPLVFDADALNILGERRDLLARCASPILTPHAGEFERMFGVLGGSKVERARAASAQSGAVIIFKGPDTVVAAPDGRAAIAANASAWLATAGTGDVLTGIVAAMRARGLEPFEAACAGVWLHGRASVESGPGLIADDLLDALPSLIGVCE